MLKKILIANRGEIAIRIARSCRKMGIGTVAVYSEVDYRSRHVREADERVFIGRAPSSKSYLSGEKIVAVALERECEAVHPGYGFLSENAAFAKMVSEAGLTFVGPPASAIAALGDKLESKVLALQAGLPVCPGHHEAITDLDEALSIIRAIGLPVLLKPAAGGGGRGMRVVTREDELAQAWRACREETRKAFADDRIFIERYIARPRHIEVQIVADNFGDVIHLGERECSIQRRYQKVVEETPSVAVDAELRDTLGRLACKVAKEAHYSNAGTVEFILDQTGAFYFLEMNTRLQVEHPITEMVTGMDLVELQIRIAAGEPLPLRQEDVTLSGWAIEARVCAEDPVRGFLPTTGMITRYALPSVKNVRVDSGIEAGSAITIYYDSLLAKVAAWGENREEARLALVRALNGYHIEGLATNVDFVNAIVNYPAFIQGDLSTHFIEENGLDDYNNLTPNPDHLAYMVIASVLVYHTRQYLVRESLKPMSPLVGAGSSPKKFHDYVVKVDDQALEVRIEGDRITGWWDVRVDGREYEVVAPEFEYYRRRLFLRIDGQSHMFRLRWHAQHLKTFFCGIVRVCEIYSPDEWKLAHYMLRRGEELQEKALRCPMPGLVTALSVKKGDYVRKGQEVLRMESMKMESSIESPRDALVAKVLVEVGQAMDTDQELILFEDS